MSRRSVPLGLAIAAVALGLTALVAAAVLATRSSSGPSLAADDGAATDPVAADDSNGAAGAATDGGADGDGSGPVGTTTIPAPAPTDPSSGSVQAPDPTVIRIPTLGVDAPMIPLGLRPDRSIEVPEDFDETGWWVDGPEPGEPGPAVVLGHVDSKAGPAVFHGLRDLRPGDEVIIDREDGSSVTWVVERLEQHPKDDFPTEAVYGDTPGPELRLVTCGGVFDRGIGHYEDNVIVFASPA